MNLLNISTVSDVQTAKTNEQCALQRAENLSLIINLQYKAVLELCVGPSLEILEKAYSNFNLKVTGNDIDYRWKNYFPEGNWIIGDALEQNYNLFDAIVFAPPLTHGCTGRREDALSIEDINPSYYKFIDKVISQSYNGIVVLVLPAKALATKKDRQQLHKLLKFVSNNFNYELCELKCGKRNIRKYIDIYLI